MTSTPPSREVIEEGQSRARDLAEGLYPHQVEGLAFLLARRGAILADDMGLGKTRQAVLAMTEAEPNGPYLVVAPASVKLNWQREIEIARPGSKVWVVGEPAPHDWTGWVVINYDILGRNIEWLKAMPFSGLVFDEAHYLKNHTSQRSRFGRALVESESRPLTYLLTGTPLTNRPRDLFVLLELIGHPLGKSFLSFAKRYCGAYRNRFGWVTDGATHLKELALQLSGVLLRRTKDQVLDLPPKVRTFLDVELPASAARRETRKVLELLISNELSGGGGGSADGGKARVDLLSSLTKARHVLAKAKTKATLDFVSGAVAQGEKVLVFSCFDAPLQKIAERFGDECVLLTGKTPTGKRQALVDRFQDDPEVKVFAANIIAGGIGINLTAARQVVFNDLDWVPANHWQAEDRAYRIGQTGSVHVAYMVAPGTMDDFVKRVLEVKAALVETVIDGKALEGGVGKSAMDELQRLVRSISPNLADASVDRSDPDWIRQLLQQAADAYREENPVQASDATSGPAPTDAELITLLAQALAGPTAATYRIATASKTGDYYTLTANGTDVTCTCSGFEYRGMCSHARTLKEALVEGDDPPQEYTRAD